LKLFDDSLVLLSSSLVSFYSWPFRVSRRWALKDRSLLSRDSYELQCSIVDFRHGGLGARVDPVTEEEVRLIVS
jgi:hypothetical protein